MANTKKSSKQSYKLKVIPLGGLHEVGKNSFLVSSCTAEDPGNDEYVLVDAGIKFFGDDNPGIDYSMADNSFIDKIKNKISALVLTSVSPRHSGGAHHLICKYGIKKIAAPSLVIEMLKAKIAIFGEELLEDIEFIEFNSREQVKIGAIKVTPFLVNSGDGDTFALGIENTNKKIFYTGSYKLDQTPVHCDRMDLAGIINFSNGDSEGEKPINLFIASSIGVEKEGYSKSEMELISSFTKIFQDNLESRLIFNTYSHNILRIQTIVDLANKFNRKIVLIHREARQIVEVARKAGKLSLSPESIVDFNDLEQYKDSEIVCISVAPEDRALEVLEIIAYEQSSELILHKGDVVINSADLPPGTVRTMAQISDQLFLKDVKIIGGRNASVQVDPYALTEEMKFFFNLVKAQYFLPAFGETRQLVRHAKLAVETSFDPGSILILDNGDEIEVQDKIVKVTGQNKLEDSYFSRVQHFELPGEILEERDLMSREGVVTIAFSINKNKKVVVGPVFSARACTFSNNKEWRAFCMMNTASLVDLIEGYFADKASMTIEEAERLVKGHMEKLIRQYIGKRPLLIVHGGQV